VSKPLKSKSTCTQSETTQHGLMLNFIGIKALKILPKIALKLGKTHQFTRRYLL
jgi:hypothetical protein